jgi:hypothetical protein
MDAHAINANRSYCLKSSTYDAIKRIFVPEQASAIPYSISPLSQMHVCCSFIIRAGVTVPADWKTRTFHWFLFIRVQFGDMYVAESSSHSNTNESRRIFLLWGTNFTRTSFVSTYFHAQSYDVPTGWKIAAWSASSIIPQTDQKYVWSEILNPRHSTERRPTTHRSDKTGRERRDRRRSSHDTSSLLPSLPNPAHSHEEQPPNQLSAYLYISNDNASRVPS